MTINYTFNGEHFDYEVDYEKYQEALKCTLMKQLKEELVELILNADNCVIDLEQEYKDELKEIFEDKAYAEYNDRRFA